jgi:hypothetical protein
MELECAGEEEQNICNERDDGECYCGIEKVSCDSRADLFSSWLHGGDEV